MHQFNRFYLLFSLVFSLVVPFITIEIIQEITTPIAQNNAIQINQNQESNEDKYNLLVNFNEFAEKRAFLHIGRSNPVHKLNGKKVMSLSCKKIVIFMKNFAETRK